ncbi:MAG: outer membrane beta-barrel protein [Phenylobacterium sp.]|uniref:outer membrane beta-barrel protein n=1 Tax=Phenylobacterium sp. TaxID=1871053 RepID=UPI00391A4D4D
MKLGKVLLCIAASPFALLAGVAHAQDESISGGLNTSAADLFARNRNVSVRERPHPEYEALGLRAGSFLIYPRLEAAVESNDNIYATETNEQSDTIWRLSPSVNLISNWSRHSLQAYARGSFTRYADFDEENADDFELGARGRVDIQRFFEVNLEGSHARLTEPRVAQNTPDAAEAPIEYDLDRARIGARKTFNRIRVGGDFAYDKYDYDDGRTIGTATSPSVVIDQDNRDREVMEISGRVDYAVSPDTAVFVQVSHNTRAYDIASTPLVAARDSDGYEVLAGADFEVSRLVRGDAAVGYLSQDFEDVRFQDIDGFGARMKLEWFPTQLTTVTGNVSRVVEDSVVIGAGGFLSTTASLQVDHEFMRNVILTGQVSYASDDFEGVDRKDDRWLGALSGTYLLNRYVGVGLTYSYFDQGSEGLDRGREFTVQKVALSLVLQR